MYHISPYFYNEFFIMQIYPGKNLPRKGRIMCKLFSYHGIQKYIILHTLALTLIHGFLSSCILPKKHFSADTKEASVSFILSNWHWLLIYFVLVSWPYSLAYWCDDQIWTKLRPPLLCPLHDPKFAQVPQTGWSPLWVGQMKVWLMTASNHS